MNKKLLLGILMVLFVGFLGNAGDLSAEEPQKEPIKVSLIEFAEIIEKAIEEKSINKPISGKIFDNSLQISLFPLDKWVLSLRTMEMMFSDPSFFLHFNKFLGDFPLVGEYIKQHPEIDKSAILNVRGKIKGYILHNKKFHFLFEIERVEISKPK